MTRERMMRRIKCLELGDFPHYAVKISESLDFISLGIALKTFQSPTDLLLCLRRSLSSCIIWILMRSILLFRLLF